MRIYWLFVVVCLSLAGCAERDSAKSPAGSDACVAAEQLDPDQARLVDIAKQDVSPDARLAAIQDLFDLAERYLIIEKYGDKEYDDVPYTEEQRRHVAEQRRIILARMGDIAKHDPEPRVRCAAAARLIDWAVLAEIAKNDESADVRDAAVQNLTDTAICYKVDARTIGRDALVDFILTPEYPTYELARAAYDREMEKERQHAEEQLQVVLGWLADVATGSKYADARLWACHHLTDQALLAEIAKNDEDENVRVNVSGLLENRREQRE